MKKLLLVFVLLLLVFTANAQKSTDVFYPKPVVKIYGTTAYLMYNHPVTIGIYKKDTGLLFWQITDYKVQSVKKRKIILNVPKGEYYFVVKDSVNIINNSVSIR